MLVALNRPFYKLLLRRRGPMETAGGVVVHMVHHLVSLASVLAGVLIHLTEARRATEEQPEPVRSEDVPSLEVTVNGGSPREPAPTLSA
jgi:hypothetical protein